jgi:hypothetical protein
MHPKRCSTAPILSNPEYRQSIEDGIDERGDDDGMVVV